MADDRGGAWSSLSRLRADPRQRVGVSCCGQNMHHGTGAIRHLMALWEKVCRYIGLVASLVERISGGGDPVGIRTA